MTTFALAVFQTQPTIVLFSFAKDGGFDSRRADSQVSVESRRQTRNFTNCRVYFYEQAVENALSVKGRRNPVRAVQFGNRRNTEMHLHKLPAQFCPVA